MEFIIIMRYSARQPTGQPAAQTESPDTRPITRNPKTENNYPQRPLSIPEQKCKVEEERKNPRDSYN